MSYACTGLIACVEEPESAESEVTPSSARFWGLGVRGLGGLGGLGFRV